MARTVAVRLQAEIGQYVGGMNKAAAATMRLGESASATNKKAASGFDLAGKSALLMGGAVVGGLGLAVSKSLQFEKSMSAVGAATNATTGTLKDLRDAAMKAGADTQYSATEAAGAITEMAKAGVAAKDIMGGGLSGALSLAAAGQLEVGKAAEIASVAMTQFNLTGEDLPHVADLLAAGAGKAMGSVEDLGMALNQSGLIASAAGLSIEETTGTLAAFASAGLIGSDAGTSFKTMLQAIQAPSGKSAELMAELGINMYDASGNMLGASEMAGVLQKALGGLTEEQRNAAIAQIFGTDAARAANVLYKEGAAGIEEWTRKVNDSGYAAEQAAKLNDNLAGDLERLGGAFETLLIAIGEGAQGPLRALTQALTGIVDGVAGLVEAWQSLPAPIQTALVTLGAVAALKGPLGGTLDVLREFGKGLGSSIGGTFSAFNQALGYARANGDGLGTVLRSVGDYAATGLKAGFSSLLGFFGGPWGLAITGATVGLSLLVSWLGKSDTATDDLATAQSSLASALQVTNGVIDDSVRRTAAKVLQDQHLLEFTDLYGVKSQDMVGYVLGEADAHDRVSGSLDRYRSSLEAKLTGDKEADIFTQAAIDAVDRHKAALDGLATGTDTQVGKERQLAEATGATGGAMELSTAQTEAAVAAQEKWLANLADIGTAFVEPLGAYKGLLQEKQAAEQASAEKTASSTESSSDSWRDYVGDVTVSLDELATRLEEQLLAQENWRANIVTITQRGGLEVGQAIAAMGEEGVDLAAQMADGTDAEFDRMAALLIEDARRGGAGAAAALDNEMKVMAAVGAAGAGATAKGIADKLGLGVYEVLRIASEYGVALATGINPILGALGKNAIAVVRRGGASSYDQAGRGGYADGGYTGPGGKYQPAGIVHAGEFVLTQDEVNRLGIDRIEEFANNGYATGGFVSAASVPKPRSTAPYRAPISTAGDATMQKGYDETISWLAANLAPPPSSGGGPAGAGGIGGGWTSIFNYVKARIPQARANSTFRAGDPGYHGRGKAVDFGFGSGPGGAGSAGLASINRLLHDGIGKNLAELIYDGIGDDRPDLKNGRPLTYSKKTQLEHRNHVHAATYDQGGWLQPGYTMAYNGTGAPERVLTSREFSGGGRGAGGSGGAANVTVQARVFIGNREITDIARVEAEAVVVGAFTGAMNRGGYNR